jgi:hypothetical protein
VFLAQRATPGPANLTRRVASTPLAAPGQRELRKKLALAVKQRSEALVLFFEDNENADDPSETQFEQIQRHGTQQLFRYLQDFAFASDDDEEEDEDEEAEGSGEGTPRRVKRPANWNDRVADNSRFGRLRLRQGTGTQVNVNRMARDNLNKPQDYDSIVEKDYHVLSVFVRTLHRLVNERVQRAFALPDYDVSRPLTGVLQPNCNVTRGEAARRFLHLSQRAFWTQVRTVQQNLPNWPSSLPAPLLAPPRGRSPRARAFRTAARVRIYICL